MSETIIDKLADFSLGTDFADLPPDVVHESKRILLDTVGCALGGLEEPKGTIGLRIGDLMSGDGGTATVIGTGARRTEYAAAFANGELMNALDFDIVMPPGHVVPYVLPVILAVGETNRSSGRDVLAAIALSHEISNRFGKAMDNLRDTKDGKVDPPSVFGYSSTIFGGVAAGIKMKRLSREVMVNGLGIAGLIAPINSHWPWTQHAPPTTIKYQMAGPLTQAMLTAIYSAEFGHRGDMQVLDDAEVGFAKMINTRRWHPERITAALGEIWHFPAELSYKPYPHCRILHGPFDVLIRMVEENDLQPAEIDSITVFGEGVMNQPIWLSRQIDHVIDAQFSVAHGMALAAHRIPAGPRWQHPDTVYDRSILALMSKVRQDLHPDYVQQMTGNAASRPSLVKVEARGRTFVGEALYPKGRLSPDPESYMTDAEVIAKFHVNADGRLSRDVAQSICDRVMSLEQEAEIGPIMALLGGLEPAHPLEAVSAAFG